MVLIVVLVTGLCMSLSGSPSGSPELLSQNDSARREFVPPLERVGLDCFPGGVLVL